MKVSKLVEAEKNAISGFLGLLFPYDGSAGSLPTWLSFCANDGGLSLLASSFVARESTANGT